MKLDRRTTLAIIAVVVIVASVVVFAYYVNLKKGCQSKPDQGFLIVASADGYNDSIVHGAPQNSWPVISVPKGATVTITVCNSDRQAHGFQVSHYLDSPIETVAPGQTITVSFVANQTGTFKIYCSIFCTIHAFMQNGSIIVT